MMIAGVSMAGRSRGITGLLDGVTTNPSLGAKTGATREAAADGSAVPDPGPLPGLNKLVAYKKEESPTS